MNVLQIDSTAGGTTIDAAGNREFIHIYNIGPETIFLKYDGDAAVLTPANGWPVPANTWYNLDNDGSKPIFNKAVKAITASGTAEIRIQGA